MIRLQCNPCLLMFEPAASKTVATSGRERRACSAPDDLLMYSLRWSGCCASLSHQAKINPVDVATRHVSQRLTDSSTVHLVPRGDVEKGRPLFSPDLANAGRLQLNWTPIKSLQPGFEALAAGLGIMYKRVVGTNEHKRRLRVCRRQIRTTTLDARIRAPRPATICLKASAIDQSALASS